MEARLIRAALLVAITLSLGASHRTPNFVVSAPTQDVAEQVGRAAEKFRRELAIEWLGQPMRNWSQPCPITVQVGSHLGAGGATSFVFDHGQVFGWRMTIQGPLDRILDSVLPHEITHTIFATYFRQPLPRWADEGASSTVEHSSERVKQQRMLVEFLKTGRGIPFGHMFAMKEYPRDVLPLYAQGHSLATYLIAQGGKKKYMRFVADGLQRGQWTEVTTLHYGFANLAALQEDWLGWVRRGSPLPLDHPNRSVADAQTDRPPAQAVTHAPRRSRPGPNLIHREAASDGVASRLVPVTRPGSLTFPGPEPDEAVDGPIVNQVTRPPPVEQVRQVILEWDHRDGTAQGKPPAAANPESDGRSRSVYETRAKQGRR